MNVAQRAGKLVTLKQYFRDIKAIIYKMVHRTPTPPLPLPCMGGECLEVVTQTLFPRQCRGDAGVGQVTNAI